ncbi:g10263 [Coccomyxa elongata]
MFDDGDDVITRAPTGTWQNDVASKASWDLDQRDPASTRRFPCEFWVLVRYAHTVQLAVAAVVLHKEWASAAGTLKLPAVNPLADEVEPVEAVTTWKLAPLSAEQRARVATALAQSIPTQQSLAATLEKVQAAEQRLKGLQEGNLSLRTDIGAEEIKLQAASQVLKAKLEDLLDLCSQLENALDLCEVSSWDAPTQPEDAEASAMYEELLRKLQDSRAEAQAFVRVSHFIMDEALSKKESLNAHTNP